MKKFEVPKIEVITFTKNDVVLASTCYDYVCPDCPVECDSSYKCLVH